MLQYPVCIVCITILLAAAKISDLPLYNVTEQKFVASCSPSSISVSQFLLRKVSSDEFTLRWMICKTWQASMLTQLRRTASFTMKSRISRVTSVCSAVSDHSVQQGIKTLAAWILVLMER